MKRALLIVVWFMVISSRAAEVTVFFDGFETGSSLSNNWQLIDLTDPDEPAPAYAWGIVNQSFGGEAPRSGVRKAYCAGRGYLGGTSFPMYRNDLASLMVRTNIDLRGCTSAELSFWHKVIIPDVFAISSLGIDEDGMSVYIDDWPLPIFSTFTGAKVTNWTKVTLPLNDYLGDIHRIAFEFVSGGDNPIFDKINNPDEWIDGDPDFGVAVGAGAYEGVYLDDVLVTAQTLSFESVTNTADHVQLTLNAEAGFTYQIESSPDLSSWNLLTNVLATNTTFEVNDSLTNSARFYRAVLPR